MPPRAVDLFCGAGGGSVGLTDAGIEVVGAADADGAACETYAANHRIAPVQTDLGESDAASLAEVGLDLDAADVLLGCPPCKNFSSLRRTSGGVDGPRDTLLRSFLRLVEEARPPVVVFENVRRFSRLDGGRFRDLLVDRLGEAGYGHAIRVVNAANYGVPQRRERTIGLFVRGEYSVALPEPTHSTPVDGALPDWNTVRDAIGDLPAVGAGEDVGNGHRATNHRESTLEVIRAVPEDGGSRAAVPDELLPDCYRRLGDSEATNMYGRMAWDEPAPTLTTECCTPSSGRFIHPVQDRAITPREAARLMTFPDEFHLPDSKTAATTLVGNAVPPRLVEAIARHAVSEYL